ncbi:hypothetical protein FKW77_006924 [Venturia effusa]|uniref:F-box domain-containing protein n=1 Tax=Venturia effusa TaxID=50376 RepID=A0A517LHG3_9PEZI|nr:hypothetical protein FKW77_006924 [Venturia effusa]
MATREEIFIPAKTSIPTSTPLITPSMDHRRRRLTTLPPELLLLIYSNLRPAAKLALTLTSRTLYLKLPTLASSKTTVPTTQCTQASQATTTLALPLCARKAIATYLSYPKRRKNRRNCTFCSQWYPSTLFGNPWSPLSTETMDERRNRQEEMSAQLIEDGVDAMGGPGMITLPPEICAWHRGAFTVLVDGPPPSSSSFPWTSSPQQPQQQEKTNNEPRYPIQTPPTPSPFPDLRPGWWRIPSLLCKHCKKISTPLRQFGESVSPVKSITEGDMESMMGFCERMVLWGSCPQCRGCDDCGLLLVKVFVRIARGYEKSVEDSECDGVSAGDLDAIASSRGGKIDGDGLLVDTPGRFVVYREGGKVMVREWETRNKKSPHRDICVKRIR